MLDRVNPYETPASSLAEPAAAGHALFSVGPVKLALLSVSTLGLYEAYWFYENWRRTRDHEGTTILPLFRGLFAPLFAYPLFWRIARRAQAAGVSVPWAPSTLALLYLALLACTRLPGLWWLVSLGSFLPVLQAQATAAELNVQSGLPAHPWSQISPLNWLAIVLGLGFLALLAAYRLEIVVS